MFKKVTKVLAGLWLGIALLSAATPVPGMPTTTVFNGNTLVENATELQIGDQLRKNTLTDQLFVKSSYLDATAFSPEWSVITPVPSAGQTALKIYSNGPRSMIRGRVNDSNSGDYTVNLTSGKLYEHLLLNNGINYVGYSIFEDTYIDVNYTRYLTNVTIQSNINGTTNPSPGAYSIFVNDTLPVTAVPDAGYTFIEWEGDNTQGASLINLRPTTPAGLTVKPNFTRTGGLKLTTNVDHNLPITLSATTPNGLAFTQNNYINQTEHTVTLPKGWVYHIRIPNVSHYGFSLSSIQFDGVNINYNSIVNGPITEVTFSISTSEPVHNLRVNYTQIVKQLTIATNTPQVTSLPLPGTYALNQGTQITITGLRTDNANPVIPLYWLISTDGIQRVLYNSRVNTLNITSDTTATLVADTCYKVSIVNMPGGSCYLDKASYSDVPLNLSEIFNQSNGNVGLLPQGTKLAIHATPVQGKRFKQWQLTGAPVTTAITMPYLVITIPANDITVTPVYEDARSQSVSIVSALGGTVVPEGLQTLPITVTASANLNYYTDGYVATGGLIVSTVSNTSSTGTYTLGITGLSNNYGYTYTTIPGAYTAPDLRTTIREALSIGGSISGTSIPVVGYTLGFDTGTNVTGELADNINFTISNGNIQLTLGTTLPVTIAAPLLPGKQYLTVTADTIALNNSTLANSTVQQELTAVNANNCTITEVTNSNLQYHQLLAVVPVFTAKFKEYRTLTLGLPSRSEFGRLSATALGMQSTGSGTYKIPYDTDVTVTYTPGAWATFNGWSATGIAADNTAVTLSFRITGDTSITALYTILKTHITITSEGSGTTNITDSEVPYGTTISLIATPNTGWMFKQWEGADLNLLQDITKQTNTFTVSQPNVTLSCRFLKTYILTTNSSVGGTTSPQPGTTTRVEQETAYPIVAMPEANYNFDRWIVRVGNQGQILDSTVASTTIGLYTRYAVNQPLTTYGNGYIIAPVTGTYRFYGSDYTIASRSPSNGLVTLALTAGEAYPISMVTAPEVTLVSPTYSINTREVLPLSWLSGIVNPQITQTQGDTTVQATFKRKLTTVLINSGANGSVLSSRIEVPMGEPVTASAIPDDGYVFDKWTGNTGTLSNTKNANTLVQTNGVITINLLANFVRGVTLSVIQDNNATLNPVGISTHKYGDIITISAAPKAGYSFSRWSIKDVDGETTVITNPYTITLTKDTNIAVVLAETTRQLDIQTTHGGTVSPIGLLSYPINTYAFITPIPDAGYLFSGWSTEATVTPYRGGYNVLVDKNQAITANFTKAHTLNLSTSPGGTISIQPGTYIYPDNTVIKVRANPPTLGYSFIAWTGDVPQGISPSTTELQVTLTKDTTLSALYAPSLYQVALETDGSGVLESPASAYRLSGAKYTAKVRTLDTINTIFVGWKDLTTGEFASTDLAYTFEVQRNIALRAIFSKVTTLTLTCNNQADHIRADFLAAYTEGGERIARDDSYNGANGTKISIKVPVNYPIDINYTAAPNNKFSYWYGPSIALLTSSTQRSSASMPIQANKHTIIVTGPISLYATSEHYYTVTTTAAGPGQVTTALLSDSSYALASYYKAQTKLLAYATANPYARFTGWSGDTALLLDTTNRKTQLTVLRDTSLTANFTQETYTLSATTEAAGSINLQAITEIPAGNSINVTATPKIGFKFKAWEGTGIYGLLDQQPTTKYIAMQNNLALRATYTPQTYQVTVNLINSQPQVYTVNAGGVLDLRSIVTYAPQGTTFAYWSGPDSSFLRLADATMNQQTNPVLSPAVQLTGIYRDMQLTAVFQRTYKLTVTNTPGVSGKYVGETNIPVNTKLTLPITIAPGFKLVGWEGPSKADLDLRDRFNPLLEMNSDKVLSISAVPDNITLRITGSNAQFPGNDIAITKTFPRNSTAMLTTNEVMSWALPGYTFSNWSGEDYSVLTTPNTAATQVLLLKDTHVHVNFLPGFSLKVTTSDGGTVILSHQ